jgi:hypothetical protein
MSYIINFNEMATKKASAAKTTATKKKISLEVIRNRAHDIYLKRIKKRMHGDADSDWFQAEKELMN